MKILVDKEYRKIFFDENLEEIHTHIGIIKRADFEKTNSGNKIKTHLGKELLVIEADFPDLFENIERGPAIILPKDAGVISSYTGISSGSRVVEAGSGSGAFTCYLANLVKPNGKVYSYEKRKEFLEIAKRNIEKMKLSDFVEFKNKSTHETIEEKEIDVIVLDMPDPWLSIKNAESALKTGGFLVCYLPHIEQIQELLKNLKDTSLVFLKAVDLVENEADEKLRFRVKIKHTAYLVFLRKL